ncbi:PhoX family protein [Micromonospora sp. DT227]|uniref:PhoX family protein n=1 Tax=Micromonospora sp. DT227 TaxID=3393433 RepID=UPI003CED5F23
MPREHPLLPIVSLPFRRAGRDPMTCRYRCANSCAHPEPNASSTPYFGEILERSLSRRGVARAGALGLLVVGTAASTAGPAAAAPAAPPSGTTSTSGGRPGRPLPFEAVPPNTIDAVVTPPGYQHAVVVKWGDPILPGAPEWDLHRQTAEAQEQQFGYNNDYLAMLPLGTGGRRALLVGNHEYANPELMFPGYTGIPDAAQTAVMFASAGMFVVEIEQVERTGQWRLVRSGQRPYNRRITTTNTVFELTGPAAGSALLRTAADPAGRWVRGTQANCSGGVTPWGTVLSGEENFHFAFVGADEAPESMKPALRRYGFDTANRGGPSAELIDERFDLARHPHEANRFGWIVEVDPFDRASVPRKHTALGRFKHEGAATVISRGGHAVVYSGDDERFEYIYKFVSQGRMDRAKSRAARQRNMTLLASGTLYVAAFDATSAAEIDGSGTLPADGAFNGRGRWIPLASDTTSFVPGMTVAEVLVNTRLAADAVGATKMDRPEDIEPSPVTGKVYCALTNNSRRGADANPPADEVNPRNANRHGHIVEIAEDRGDHTATTFVWSVPVVCGDPQDPSTYFSGYDKSAVSPISCPDNLTFDSTGNLWIATDSAYALGGNDGLFAMPLAGPETGHVKQFLSVPVGAECCGPVISSDGRSCFVAVQHPGEITNSTVENPGSRWPDGDFGKPGIVVTWRPDGRRIGA